MAIGQTSKPPLREPTEDEAMGIAWWNFMTSAERAAVMGGAEGVLGRPASVADAWELWKAGRVSMRWDDVEAAA